MHVVRSGRLDGRRLSCEEEAAQFIDGKGEVLCRTAHLKFVAVDDNFQAIHGEAILHSRVGAEGEVVKVLRAGGQYAEGAEECE